MLEELQEALEIVSKRDAIIRIEADRALFVGDLHGYPDVLDYVERELEDRKMTVIFLGDYVDRGPKQIETLERVISLQIAYPDRVFMLRGNHEDEHVNRMFDFYYVVSRKFGEEKYELFKEFFAELPIAAVVNEKVFAIHGGISVHEPKPEEMLEKLKKSPSTVEYPLLEPLRNDPNDSIEDHKPSVRGSGIYEFGRKPFEAFLKRYGFTIVIRAHQVFYNGYMRHFGGKMLTITSFPPAMRVAEAYFYRGEPVVRVARPKIYRKIYIFLSGMIARTKTIVRSDATTSVGMNESIAEKSK